MRGGKLCSGTVVVSKRWLCEGGSWDGNDPDRSGTGLESWISHWYEGKLPVVMVTALLSW